MRDLSTCLNFLSSLQYEAPAGVQIGTVSTDLSCTVSLLDLLPITQSSINLKLGGALTTTVARSQGFYLNGRAIITIPANLTTLLATVGVQSISGNARSVTLSSLGILNNKPNTVI